MEIDESHLARERENVPSQMRCAKASDWDHWQKKGVPQECDTLSQSENKLSETLMLWRLRSSELPRLGYECQSPRTTFRKTLTPQKSTIRPEGHRPPKETPAWK